MNSENLSNHDLPSVIREHGSLLLAQPPRLRGAQPTVSAVKAWHGRSQDLLTDHDSPFRLTLGNERTIDLRKSRPIDHRSSYSLSVLALALAMFGVGVAQAQNTYTYSTASNGTSWLNSSNWSGGPANTFPGVDLNATTTADGASTDIAQFNTTTSVTNTGINFNSGSGSGIGNSGKANGQLTLAGISFGGSANGFTVGSSSSAGILVLNGATFGATTNVILNDTSTGTLTIANQNSGTTATQTMALALGSTNSVIQTTGSGGIIISSAITGSGKNLSFQASSTGSLTLSGPNTFSGTFTANSGTTSLNAVGALGGVSGVSVASGATITTSLGLIGSIKSTAAITLNGALDLSSDTETVASLVGTSATASLVIGKSGSTAGTFTVGDSTNTSFAGVISGSPVNAGATIFTKQGIGTLTLSNANTYTGNTSITGGTLLAANTTGSATGTGAVSVSAAGTLASGAGTTATVSGLVTTAGTGSKIAPGTTATANTGTIGALTLNGGLNIAAGATIPFDLGDAGNTDLIKITGGTFTGGTATSSVTFNFNNLGVTDQSQYALINFTGATASGVDLSDFTSTGVGGTFVFNGTELDFIAAVPEPTTIFGSLLMVGALGWSQRRRLLGALAGSMQTHLAA